MSAVWVVNDDRGLVGAFSDLSTASEFVELYPSTPFCITRQPLLQSEGEAPSDKVYVLFHRRPDAVAAVAADPAAWTERRDEMLKTGSTYPDPIGFFTRTVNKVHPNTLTRLETREMEAEADAAIAEPAASPTEEPAAEPATSPTEEPAAEPATSPTEEPPAAIESAASPTEEPPAAEPAAEPAE